MTGMIKHTIGKPALALTWSVLVWALAQIVQAAQDFYPSLTLDGQTYTKVYVVEANPVQLLFRADGPAYKWVKLQDLPEGLKARYPYDPVKATEYEKAKAEQARQQREQLRRQAYERLQGQEAQLVAQIEKSERERVSVQKQIRGWRAKPKRTPGRGIALDQLLNTRMALERHIENLRSQLESVRGMILRYR